MSEDAHIVSLNTLVVQDASRTLEREATSPFSLECNVVLSHQREEITNQQMGAIDNEIKSTLKEIRARELSESVQLPIYRHNSTFNIKMEPDPNVANEERVCPSNTNIEPALLTNIVEVLVTMEEAQRDNYQTGSKSPECYAVVTAEAQVNETQNALFGLGTENTCHVASQSNAIVVMGIPDSQACLPKRSKEDTRTAMDFRCREGQDPYVITEVPEKAAQTGQLLTHDFVLSNQMQSNQKDKDRDTSTPGRQIHSKPLPDNKLAGPTKQLELVNGEEKRVLSKQKLKRSRNNSVPAKDNKLDSTRKTPKNQLEQKTLPTFESFLVEEEEGSGGYGTVYKARRKHDGKTVAVKCPHANAHIHHVNNELKMLERFGGRNFIIKYEGSFRSGNSECFVLEHVQHDRPEVLKREIDIFELQWYGYCMFRALASLHKHGVVHRDVKPGNFLFSRKYNKGYLIDFNLAQDLHQKYHTISKSTMNSNRYLDHSPLPFSGLKDVPSKQVKKIVNGRLVESLSSFKEAASDSKLCLETKNMKRRAGTSQLKNTVDLRSRNKHRNPAGDASGITPTSTRTPSVDKLKEPMPCQGRKELINLVQEAMQGPVHEAVSVPVSQRKRVAAPLGNVDGKLVFPTPMPLHSNGVVIYGAGHLKTRGDGKPKREGPCVGTKGFRAPEVLFKSPHQGPKVDIWSAGVTLLYLMIGRAPFVGDPEQNLKDVAQLRGSEELWEVAKVHNRESSFPVDLFDIQSLLPMELQEWCEINTRRLGFLDRIPGSLFDLVDKCLTVNPRLRISAEEALQHEFFSPCREALRKQRMLRQAIGSELGSSALGTSSS